MHGAFAAKRVSGIAGKHVILIDDVATTGATLRAAARALWDLGPASVDALVITIADPR
jgi:predicted amidophosphoribosyltransferase